MPYRGGVVTPEQTFELAKAVLLAVVTVVTGALGACITFWLKRPEVAANVRKTQADAEKTAVEAGAMELKTLQDVADFVFGLQEQLSAVRTELARLSVENARLLVENANLSAKNAAMEAKILAQDAEIAELRRRVEDYEARFTQAGKAMAEGTL